MTNLVNVSEDIISQFSRLQWKILNDSQAGIKIDCVHRTNHNVKLSDLTRSNNGEIISIVW